MAAFRCVPKAPAAPGHEPGLCLRLPPGVLHVPRPTRSAARTTQAPVASEGLVMVEMANIAEPAAKAAASELTSDSDDSDAAGPLNRQEGGTAKKRRGRARGGWQVHYTPPQRRVATDGGYLSGEGLERFLHDAALAVGDVLTVGRASARADNSLLVTVVRAALGSAAKKPRGKSKSARRAKVLHK